MQQHQVFQSYLMRCKKEVYLNLKRKIFPQTKYEDYDFIEVLGQGSYGQVVSALNIQSKKVFAVKIIRKKILVTNKRLRHLISEIKILNSVKFEFLISLECYFTNKCYVFIVLPYISGGHFFTLLKKVKKFDEDAARFFAGQVILTIEYLHFMGIVYRDLKPENLLLDLQGYLKVVDYGFAKYIGHSYTYTLCGTPEYLAPEVLLGDAALYTAILCSLCQMFTQNLQTIKGYSLSPDWWTLGILLYEMCNGKPPFTSTNDLKMYEKILVGNIHWPQHFSFELKSIIQGLLQVDKTKRLGCMKGKAQDVKFHKWFSGLDWNALWNKKILPPISNPSRKQSKIKNPDGLKLNISLTKCSNLIPPEMIGNIDTAI